MSKYWYVLIGALLGGTVAAGHFKEQAYETALRNNLSWKRSVLELSATLKGMPSRDRTHFDNLDASSYDHKDLFGPVSDLEYVELVLALANSAHRARSDCSGVWGKLWRMCPDMLIRFELARLMFGLTSEDHPLRGKRSEITRHRFIDAEWLVANRWIVKDITDYFYPSPPYLAKQLTKKECLLKHARMYASRMVPSQAQAYLAHYKQRAAYLQMHTALTHYIPYQYLIDNESEIREKWSGPCIATVVTEQPLLRSQTGTHNLISHIGFVCLDNDQLLFRFADTECVRDVPLLTFMQQCKKKDGWSHTVHGVQFAHITPFNEQDRH